MRKILGIVFVLLVLTGIILAQTVSPNERKEKMSKILVVYYSHSGNTREIARTLQDLTGGGIFEIQTVTPYPAEYSAIVEQVRKEKSAGFKPKIKDGFAGSQDYDIVFLGSPCWYGTIATPVEAFLSEQDFSGKTIVPFITHGGSGLGSAAQDISALQPSANVAHGKAFNRSSARSAQKEIADWLASFL
ncbi:NADPH-dependent FMN reductase [Candidatus Termititenax aidoneus]|uniref:NADPH-dependent FMN reductase n=1 Tax=Termititenax aidoneus TaxID=2218524 RepID=A0A388TDR3_TERA1|nr:NADPH-dependent FMN reductase [Candidatus Termititenax aidoneus]